jgi:hypothetical protein
MVERAASGASDRHPAITDLRCDAGRLLVRESPVASQDSVRWNVVTLSPNAMRIAGYFVLGSRDRLVWDLGSRLFVLNENPRDTSWRLLVVELSDGALPP